MSTNNQVLNIIYNVFGNTPKKHTRGRSQIAYDCPNCDHGQGKGNLEINYNKLVHKCWSCGDHPDGFKGSLRKLIKSQGSNRDLKLYDEVTEDHVYSTKKGFNLNYVPVIKLPNEYIRMSTAKRNNEFLQAYNYLRGRGINDELIEKYDIGFCNGGKYDGRIIIPSYDKKGNLNFFVARTYFGHKQKYDNPIVEKNEIIVNELNLNWDSTIYLVEGMFDMIGLGIENTIPLLGKELSPRLYYELLKKCNAYVVICLDPDATQNAYKIYQQLNSTLELNGRVRVIDLPMNKDIAKIREDYGERGVLKCIKKMRELELEDKILYNLI